MAQPSQKGGSAKVLGGIAVGIVIAIIILGFAPIFPSTAYVPYTRVESTSLTYTSYTPTTIYGQTVQSSTIYFTNVQTTTIPQSEVTTTVISSQSVETESPQVYSIGSTTLQCNYYTDESANLMVGSDLAVSFSASGNLNLYVFTSSEFAAFSSSGTTSPNVATIKGQSSGSTSAPISATDTYYLVLQNPSGLLGCLGTASVGLFSATGTDTYQQTVTVYSTETGTQIYFITSTTTNTLSSVTSSTVTTSSVSSQAVTTTVVSSSTVTSTNTTTTSKGLLGP